MRESEVFTGDFEILRESAKAMLIKDPITEKECWIPFSQIDRIIRSADTNMGKITMSKWIARKNELMEE